MGCTRTNHSVGRKSIYIEEIDVKDLVDIESKHPVGIDYKSVT